MTGQARADRAQRANLMANPEILAQNSVSTQVGNLRPGVLVFFNPLLDEVRLSAKWRESKTAGHRIAVIPLIFIVCGQTEFCARIPRFAVK